MHFEAFYVKTRRMSQAIPSILECDYPFHYLPVRLGCVPHISLVRIARPKGYRTQAFGLDGKQDSKKSDECLRKVASKKHAYSHRVWARPLLGHTPPCFSVFRLKETTPPPLDADGRRRQGWRWRCVGWLVGWLAGWLAGWLDGWLLVAGWPAAGACDACRR